MTILERIRENASKYPDRYVYSYVFLDGTANPEGVIKQQSVTWSWLNEKSDRLAYALDRRLQGKAPVVVYGHKSPYMLLCFIACAKAGRTYVPIDRSVPLARVQDIICSVEPELIIATEPLDIPSRNVLHISEIEDILSQNGASIEPDKWIGAEDVFYIIFTSGSTGTPKGVQITRDCLDNFIKWGITLCGERDGARFINQAPFSFDLSVMDLYLSLYLGGTEIAIDKAIFQDTGKLMSVFQDSCADVWVSTPSFASVCLAEKSFGKDILPQLQTFLFCGETLPNHTVDKLRAAFPQAKIYNTYGPTESTVAVTSVEIDKTIAQNINPLPVGKPKPGTRILIMDERGNVLPDNEKGEIVIVGDTVGVGYWHDPEKTAQVFATYFDGNDPLRMYHTGDKGYLLDDMLYYCGRLDRQIKLHGYRMELDDIENNLEKIPNINRAAVLPVRKANGEVRSITAYVEAADGEIGGFEHEQDVRRQLKEFLPDYMIPKKIVFMKELPMTQNGKIDRKALAEQ